ncbi:hypothetical protein JCM10295v2_001262 [Rhodotorula toruloides]
MLFSSLVPAFALACFAVAVPVEEAITPVTGDSNGSFHVQAPHSFNLSKRQEYGGGNGNSGGSTRCSYVDLQNFDMSEFEGLDEPEDTVAHKGKIVVAAEDVDEHADKSPSPAVEVNEVAEQAKEKNSKVNAKDSHVVADKTVQDVVKRQGYGGGGGCGYADAAPGLGEAVDFQLLFLLPPPYGSSPQPAKMPFRFTFLALSTSLVASLLVHAAPVPQAGQVAPQQVNSPSNPSTPASVADSSNAFAANNNSPAQSTTQTTPATTGDKKQSALDKEFSAPCISYDSNGMAPDGRDRRGFDANGIDKDGFDQTGFNKDGRNRDGLDRRGYDASGKYGLDKDGYDAKGFNLQGFNREGYNAAGFNADGYDKSGYDRNGLNKDGVDRSGNGCQSTSSNSSSSNPDDSKKLGLPDLQSEMGAVPFNADQFFGSSVPTPAAMPTGQATSGTGSLNVASGAPKAGGASYGGGAGNFGGAAYAPGAANGGSENMAPASAQS